VLMHVCPIGHGALILKHSFISREQTEAAWLHMKDIPEPSTWVSQELPALFFAEPQTL
jgi:hypothetical protein